MNSAVTVPLTPETDVVNLCSDEEDPITAPKCRSDEIRTFGQELCSPQPARKRVRVVDDEDEDCVVLDFDPEKMVLSVDGAAVGGKGGDDGLEDLRIVALKGQVACRDYPHPRHLCANFPFLSVSHEKHCDMCHCFVCDIPAPCTSWSMGNANTDHCHATDKDEKWTAWRHNIKNGKVHGQSPMSPISSVDRAASCRVNILSPCSITIPNQNLNVQTEQHAVHANPSAHGFGALQPPSRMYRPSSGVLKPAVNRNSACSHTGQHSSAIPQIEAQNQLSSSNANYSRCAISNGFRMPQTVMQRSNSFPAGRNVLVRRVTVQNNSSHRSPTPYVMPPRSGSPQISLAQTATHISHQDQLLPCPFTAMQMTVAGNPNVPEDLISRSWEEILASLPCEHGSSRGMSNIVIFQQQSFHQTRQCSLLDNHFNWSNINSPPGIEASMTNHPGIPGSVDTTGSEQPLFLPSQHSRYITSSNRPDSEKSVPHHTNEQNGQVNSQHASAKQPTVSILNDANMEGSVLIHNWQTDQTMLEHRGKIAHLTSYGTEDDASKLLSTR